MKKFLLIIVSVLALVSCSKPTETIKALQDAANGEANSRARYEAFAKSAAKDSLPNISALFSAAAEAEAVHLNSILGMLSDLDVTFHPAIDKVLVDSIMSNLYMAKSAEEYEVQSMYPEMIATARGEQQYKVAKFFEATMRVEENHAALFIAAIESLQTIGNDSTISKGWLVCPVCGDMYEFLTKYTQCEGCKTPIFEFKKFGSIK